MLLLAGVRDSGIFYFFSWYLYLELSNKNSRGFTAAGEVIITMKNTRIPHTCGVDAGGLEPP
jgi:hypothetical protein